jgi:hypothetical protein
MSKNDTAPVKSAPILDIETLNAVALGLRERSDTIQQVTLLDWAVDLRTAARCADLLAHIRFELGEIAAKCTDADAAREIRDLLADAGRAEPGVGQP